MQPNVVSLDLAQIAGALIVAGLVAGGGACIGAVIGVRLLQTEFKNFKELVSTTFSMLQSAIDALKSAVTEIKTSREDCSKNHDDRLFTLEASVHGLEKDMAGLKVEFGKDWVHRG